MVGTNLPECGLLIHALVAGEGVHDGVLKGMTHVQVASNVWRWNHDAKCFLVSFIWIAAWGEETISFPLFVPALFNIFWLKRFIHNNFF